MEYEDGKYYYFIHGNGYDVGRCTKYEHGYSLHPIERHLSLQKAREMVYKLNGWDINKRKNNNNQKQNKQ